MPSTNPLDVTLLDLRTSAQTQLTEAQNVVDKLQNVLRAIDELSPTQSTTSRVAGKTRGMSAANRAAASRRMKAYWRKRRAGK